MAALLLKDVPPSLHAKLKSVAAKNRRSMNQQAIILLEESLRRQTKPSPPLPEPFVLRTPGGKRVPQTDAMIRRAVRSGRA